MPKHPDFTRQSGAFAASAARDLAGMRRALRAAQDNISGLQRAIKAPVPQGGKRYTSAVRSRPSVFERAGLNSLGNFFARGILDEFDLGSGSFSSSQAQMSSLWSDILQQGQRIR